MDSSVWYKRIDMTMQSSNPQKHQDLLEQIAACSDQARFELPQELLQKAAEYGHSEFLRTILNAFDVLPDTVVVNYSITEAASKGHLSCVEVLLPKRVREYSCNLALEAAANGGHAACVERLIPLSNGLNMDSQALRWAARRNHLECVQLLLPHSNPYDRGCEILRHACTHTNKALFDFLYPLYSLEHIKKTLDNMSDSIGHEYTAEEVEFLQQRYTASVLTQHIANLDLKSPKRVNKI